MNHKQLFCAEVLEAVTLVGTDAKAQTQRLQSSLFRSHAILEGREAQCFAAYPLCASHLRWDFLGPRSTDLNDVLLCIVGLQQVDDDI